MKQYTKVFCNFLKVSFFISTVLILAGCMNNHSDKEALVLESVELSEVIDVACKYADYGGPVEGSY